ncbi:MAG: hypothetical protein RNU03_05225 [Candidatus Sedimenticola sp. (ex Thyasira tokunagai)]
MKEQPLPPVIDIEASGFGASSYPIEIGVILPDRSACCYIIKPRKEWTFWSTEAELVHGISREQLQQHGSAPETVAIALNNQLKGQTIYTDAWGHDSSWLGKLYNAAGVSQEFRLESIRYLMSEQQTKSWHETKEQVLRELNLPRHRASSDALVIQETFKQTRDMENLQATLNQRAATARG